MKTRTANVGDLELDPQNSRRHGRKNLEAIRASLDRFGQVLPLVVRNGVVIGGNGTLVALRALNIDTCEVVEYEGTYRDATALAIALNRTSELASWDTDTLGETLVDLAEAGYVMDSLGFSESDLDDLFTIPKGGSPEVREVTFDAKIDPKNLTYSVICDLDSEEDRDELMEDLKSQGYSCRKLLK